MYFKKPIYVGQAILDLSKTLMFDFHYNHIREKFGGKADTDTDSVMYLIQTEDFYQDINKDIKRKFDTSDYPEKHPSGIKKGSNKKVIGKFKDEAAGKQITHFVCLRPKLYCFKVEDDPGTRKAKMDDFQNYIKEKFGDRTELLFSDTESSMYLIQKEDFYQINEDIKIKFGASLYPEKHPSGIDKKVIGKFKLKDNSETRKAKGVKKNVIKNTLSFEDFKECLFSEKKVMKDMNITRSKNHDVFSMTMNKLALSPNDDKRLICENKINTKALR